MCLEATYQSFLSDVPMPSCVSYNCLLHLCLVMSSEPATLKGVDLPTASVKVKAVTCDPQTAGRDCQTV